MRRLLTILGAYLAACTLGAGLFASWLIVDSPVFAPSDWVWAFITAFVVAGALAVPVALPIILATEVAEFGHWAIFLGGGVAAAAFLLWILIPDLEAEPVVLALALCPAAALIYWFIAWKRFPPKPVSDSQ